MKTTEDPRDSLELVERQIEQDLDDLMAFEEARQKREDKMSRVDLDYEDDEPIDYSPVLKSDLGDFDEDLFNDSSEDEGDF